MILHMHVIVGAGSSEISMRGTRIAARREKRFRLPICQLTSKSGSDQADRPCITQFFDGVDCQSAMVLPSPSRKSTSLTEVTEHVQEVASECVLTLSNIRNGSGVRKGLLLPGVHDPYDPPSGLVKRMHKMFLEYCFER